ncbi:DUF559 domain-containing protein [Arthrobacter gandavensis]|uniref:endonuclease domain-containing protein n=1 Tax=Arthrobacter gandavensis TaxID=169960 RepID=UPI0018905ED4|nr:DUF559 domain-containing protein [Arthrobacter gandavensis]MBF4995415.1 DUF559 domain-containing protein [Arthrobacter gandavensis]
METVDPIEAVCRAHYGVVSVGALAANGFGRSKVAAVHRGGVLQRAGRGYYRLEGAPAELVAAASLGTSLTCVSAAQLQGWWVLEPPEVLHLRADKMVDVPEIRLHRGRRSAARLVCLPTAVVLDAFRCLPPLQALVIAESAVARNAVSKAALIHAFDRPQDWRVRALLEGISRKTASPLEVCARYHLCAAGFPVQREVLVDGVGRVDFLVGGRLIIELDGYEFHSGRTEYRNDRARWNQATARGYKTLRITAEMILRSPEEFIRLVRAALARA